MADDLFERIIGAAIEVHRVLGSGLLESVYMEAICHEFSLRGISYERRVDVDVFYRDQVVKGQYFELVVGNDVIVELKPLLESAEFAKARMHSYLKATRFEKALLIDFDQERLADGITKFLR